MNYRHAYHAGNFADVAKHVILTRIVEYLKQKEKAFRVIDTHAGIGLYSLDIGEAARTGEWRDGIAKIVGADMPAPVADLLAPWLNAVRSVNSASDLRKYPGSPKLTRMLLRKQDRLSAIELHPEDAKLLARQFEGDYQVRVIELDGWLALGAHLPPKEKRGLVLVDPPFEESAEFARIVNGLRAAHERWPNGIYALWYPLKDRKAVTSFLKDLKETGIPKILNTELYVRGPSAVQTLEGSGMIIVNPPFKLADELRLIFPELMRLMQQDKGGFWRVEWVAGE
jgi:23S rRNA (adenine2030-N6)-methyltransferase